MPQKNRLLRYPILLSVESRDVIYQALKRAGLGPSVMYPASLPNISGLRSILGTEQSFPNAERFASQLITLPTHVHVNKKNIEQMRAIFIDILQ